MSGWDELVAAATVGTGTRSVVIDALPGSAGEHAGVVSVEEPAAALLDATALLLARRQAGRVPDPAAGVGRAPAEPDTAPELTAVGAGMLARQFHDRDGLVLPALLDATAAAGRLVPPPLLPALLELATRQRELRTVAAAVSGRRGRWLAGHRPEWSWLAQRPAEPADPQVWATGGRAARHAHLAALRATDPAAARDLLTAGWSRETGDDRAAFLTVLRDGLGLDDEPFLEAALDDRAAAVRATAAGLLAILPGSGYAERAAARAAAVLPRRRTVSGAVVEPAPPAGWTAVMGRDGIPQDPPQGARISHAAWWLSQVIARAPLSTWGDPETVLARTTIPGDLAPEVHAGWRAAARREADQRWISGLLAASPRLDDRTTVFRTQVWTSDVELARALPPSARAARIAHLLRTDPAGLRLAELASCPRPWPGVLADAVLARLVGAASRGALITPAVRELIRHAGPGLPAELADGVTELARRAPEYTVWPATLRGLAAVLQVRRTFAIELETPVTSTDLLRPHAEQTYAAELTALAFHDELPRPPSWRMSPQAVVSYLMGATLPDGTVITPKYVGPRRLMEVAVATLATDRALLLLGVPGTAKTWVSEHLAAAVSGDSTLLVQGTSGTAEEAIRYGWNYARLLAEGPTMAALVPSPVLTAMAEGRVARVEELTRIPSEVQDALITILSEKTLPIPELGSEVQAAKGFTVIATANDRDRGVNDLSSALRRRFNTVVLPLPASEDDEVAIVARRVDELGASLELPTVPSALEEIRRVVTVFRELRSGTTTDGRTTLKSPSGTLSTAEAISVVTSGIALAAHFGDGTLRAADIATGIRGAVIKDPVTDQVAWTEYLEAVVRERAEWGDFYRACREDGG